MDPVAEVRAFVRGIPYGEVATYGEVGRAVGLGPRQAGRAVARLDEDVPWWRVIYADGQPATCHQRGARALLESEGVPFHLDRVDLVGLRTAKDR